MSDDLRSRADARLGAALASAGLEDSRPVFRDALRRLRAEDDAAFTTLVARYDSDVLPALADGAAPLDDWLAFGHALADHLGAGRLTRIEPDGRARPFQPPYAPGTLVLHLPDDPARPALPAAVPQASSDAQQATLDLLVHGRLG